MVVRWLLAAVHLLALAIGMAAIWQRGRALKAQPLDRAALANVFQADTWWAVAAVLWLGTGIPRAVSALEKGPQYYFHNPLFHAKLTLFVVIVAMEILPMLTLIRWRRQVAKGEAVDTARAATLARISTAQAHTLVLMVLLAAAVARGIGAR